MNRGRRSALLAALAFVAGCDRDGAPGSRPQFKATDVTGADFGRSLALPDLTGRMRTLEDFKGKVTVIFFGYTQCPDVCPTTLVELAQVKKSLGAEGDRVQGVFVTIDPERDTPEVLKAYVASFDPGFVALRGTPEQTAAAAKEFKVFYAKVPGKSPGSYTMDHTAASYVLDVDGRLRLFVRYGSGAAALAADLSALLKTG
ncbi:MAG TPA: SCO family protein [Caldimonas sp.]